MKLLSAIKSIFSKRKYRFSKNSTLENETYIIESTKFINTNNFYQVEEIHRDNIINIR